jgi:peptidoglycan/LPS O-acetylase OafA/YrhL
VYVHYFVAAYHKYPRVQTKVLFERNCRPKIAFVGYYVIFQPTMMKREINPGLSVYLDLVRFGAALVVVLSHIWPLMFPGIRIFWPGHSAVVVFFVLSGFVISSTSRPEAGFGVYVLHRIARIFPLVLAAVFMSIVLSFFVGGNGLPNAESHGTNWKDIFLNFLFLGQSWGNDLLPYNAPFWSLNYEVWYYVLFGIWYYHRSRILLICAALVAGPKILLLMPVWLLGVLLHRLMTPLGRSQAMGIFLLSLGAGLLFLWLDVGMYIREAMRIVWPDLISFAQGSNQFVGDFLLGVIVSVNFLAVSSLNMRLLLKFDAMIRYFSSFTFSIYIFHMPLTVLIWNGFGMQSNFVFVGLLVLGIIILGLCTERKTKWYRSILHELIFKYRNSKNIDTDVAAILYTSGSTGPLRAERRRAVAPEHGGGRAQRCQLP